MRNGRALAGHPLSMVSQFIYFSFSVQLYFVNVHFHLTCCNTCTNIVVLIFPSCSCLTLFIFVIIFDSLWILCKPFLFCGHFMAVGTHITNSTVPDCRMRVPRRRNTSTAQSWRFVPDAVLPGHRRAHWWVPTWTPTVDQCPYNKKPWVARPHTRADGTGVRNRLE